MPPVARLRNPHSPDAPAAGNVRPRCMIRLARRSLFLCLAGLVLLCAGCGTARTGREAVRHPTLERTVMVGYQGWYRTPEDGSGLGWSHYQAPREKAPAPGRIGIDFWPDVAELTPAEKSPTTLRHADGATAFLFSSHHPLTVDRHFQWMHDYGIDGAFVQRFATNVTGTGARAELQRRATDDVLRYARSGAEHHGRAFAVMYDLSGLRAGAVSRVIEDWKHLVDDLGIRQSPAYQHHRGRPVIAVWGVGFNDRRAYSLAECATLIDFLHHDPRYGGNTVLLGVPTSWREQKRDAVADPELHAVLAKADILSPWTPGRYRDLAGVAAHAETKWTPDLAWCRARGVDYMPVVFPGFSWRNLKGITDSIDRLDGRFLWAQYHAVTHAGATMVYQAMFDEMDEGTQIFKTTNTPPLGAEFARYAPWPSDFYLRLVGRAADYVRRGATVPAAMPDIVGASATAPQSPARSAVTRR